MNKSKSIRYDTIKFSDIPVYAAAHLVKNSYMTIAVLLFLVLRTSSLLLAITETSTRKLYTAIGRYLATKDLKAFEGFKPDVNDKISTTDEFRDMFAEYLLKENRFTISGCAKALKLSDTRARELGTELEGTNIIEGIKEGMDPSLGRPLLLRNKQDIITSLDKGFIFRTIGEKIESSKKATLPRSIKVGDVTYFKGVNINDLEQSLNQRFSPSLPTALSTK